MAVMTNGIACLPIGFSAKHHRDASRAIAIGLAALGGRLMRRSRPVAGQRFDGSAALRGRHSGHVVTMDHRGTGLWLRVIGGEGRAALRVEVEQQDAGLRLRSPGEAGRAFHGLLAEWDEALRNPVGVLERNATVTSKRARAVGEAAATDFDGSWSTLRLRNGGPGPLLELSVSDFIFEFWPPTTTGRDGTMTPELHELIRPAATCYSVMARRDRGTRTTQVCMALRPPIVVFNSRDAVGALRLIADRLPAGARLLWEGVRSAPGADG